MTRRDGRTGRRPVTGNEARISGGGDVSQLLPLAVEHHEAGHLARARALYEQIIAIDPQHADALQFFGILCHQSGEAARAEELIRRAIEIKPGVAPYHDNLGTVLESAGRLEEALAEYSAAEELEPNDPDRSYNIGVVMEGLDRLESAETCYRRTLERRPDDAECRFGLGNVLKRRGASDQAETAYRLALGVAPGHAGALRNLGHLLQEQGREDEARALYRDALAAAGDSAAVLCDFGRLLQEQGRVDDALACFEQALRLDGALADARLGVARVLEAAGRLDRAWTAYRALAAAAEPVSEARAGLLRVARVRVPREHDAVLEAALLGAIESGEAPAAAFARVTGTQLLAKLGLQAGPPGDDRDALSRALDAAREPLLVAALERAVNVVPAVERWLTAVRRQLLLDAGPQAPSALAPLLRALALQCAQNEYVFSTTPEEETALGALRGEIEQRLSAGDALDASLEASLLLAACYVPLAALAGAESYASRDVGASEWLEPVLEQTLRGPLEERTLAGSVETLAEIGDPASRRVRTQYEENPYPRWTELPGPRRTADAPSGEAWPGIGGALGDAAQPLDVLVAGCGTGQEALAIARRFPGHRIWGLDLSRASLAYGARMAARLGIEDVCWVHGDLLDVARLERRFQVIAATGVLHHMRDPLAGWRALGACLAPGGLMKVGLYSRAARAVVNVARERIRALGLGAAGEDLRALRARVLGGAEPALESLTQSEDFYTISACRDLLFHTLEHQFDLGQVADMLDELGLRFLGFELAHVLIQRRFEDAALGRLDNLAAWARFEAAHPETFEAMYQFWCEKPEPAAGAGAGA